MLCRTAIWLAMAGCTLLLGGSRPAAAEETLAPLDIKLPKPYYASTPCNYEGEHFEGHILKAREPLMAPKDAQNLSQGKPVTSSDPDPNYGKLEFVTDGKIGHEQDKYVVELAYRPQWIQIDLGQTAELYAVALWHYYTNDRVYFDVVIKCAGDAEFTQNVQTTYNSDYDNSLKQGVGKDKEYLDTYEGRVIDAKGAKGRYVRLYSNGNTTDECNHYIEVQVYGKPVK